MDCESCLYYEYDDNFDDYICAADMDEDDYARLMQGHYAKRVRKRCMRS